MFKPGLTLVRFYSKRRPGLAQIKAHRAAVSSGAQHAKASRTNSSKPNDITAATTKYVNTNAFPKAPESFTNMTTDELYESIDVKLPDPITEEVKFEIPKKFSKEYQNSLLTQRDLAMIKQLDLMMNTDDEKTVLESQIILGNLYADRDSFSSFVPEHPLKKSLSGMINLNPHLNDIDDEFLWELIPPEKLFGHKFYESEGTFKDWEEHLSQEKNELIDNLKENEIQVFDFLKQFGENKNVLVKKNRRLKLNKELIKAYKSLKSKDLEVKVDEEKNDVEFKFKKNKK